VSSHHLIKAEEVFNSFFDADLDMRMSKKKQFQLFDVGKCFMTFDELR